MRHPGNKSADPLNADPLGASHWPRDCIRFEFPAEHESALRAFLKDVIYLLVIGWRASELHFLKFWAAADKYTQPRLLVVNGSSNSGAEVASALARAGIRTSQQQYFEGGFSAFLNDSGELARFLGAPLPGLEGV